MLSSFVTNPPLLGTQSSSSKSDHGPTATSSITTTSKTNSSSRTQSIVAWTAISLEYASLRHANHCPLGIYVVPSSENLLIWDAVLFVHRGSSLHCFITVLSLTHAQWSGYYTGAVLRFRLTFPDDYPERIPAVQFVTDIFHPLIDQKGYFNLSSHLRPWKCVLVVIASLLTATFLHSDRKSIMSSTSYMISRLHSRETGLTRLRRQMHGIRRHIGMLPLCACTVTLNNSSRLWVLA